MPFTTHYKLVFSLRGRGDRTGCVRFTANKVVCASKLKTQKFRSFNIEGLGKFREVVLTRGVPINAIRVRFEEGWSYFLVWKRLGKRKISCFWSGHRV